jgi:hypothetical protein
MAMAFESLCHGSGGPTISDPARLRSLFALGKAQLHGTATAGFIAPA